MKSYYSALIYKESCYSCHYATISRIGDITLGDYYGLDQKSVSKLWFNKEISILIINNEKGKILFEHAKKHLEYINSNLSESVSSNANLTSSSARHTMRDDFFKNYKDMSIPDTNKKFCKYGWKTRIALILGSKLTIYVQKITHSKQWKRIQKMML